MRSPIRWPSVRPQFAVIAARLDHGSIALRGEIPLVLFGDLVPLRPSVAGLLREPRICALLALANDFVAFVFCLGLSRSEGRSRRKADHSQGGEYREVLHDVTFQILAHCAGAWPNLSACSCAMQRNGHMRKLFDTDGEAPGAMSRAPGNVPALKARMAPSVRELMSRRAQTDRSEAPETTASLPC